MTVKLCMILSRKFSGWLNILFAIWIKNVLMYYLYDFRFLFGFGDLTNEILRLWEMTKFVTHVLTNWSLLKLFICFFSWMKFHFIKAWISNYKERLYFKFCQFDYVLILYLRNIRHTFMFFFFLIFTFFSHYLLLTFDSI